MTFETVTAIELEVAQYMQHRRRAAEWFADNETIENRIEICSKCRYLTPDGRCKAFCCNVHRAIKVSRLIAAQTEKCPRKKW